MPKGLCEPRLSICGGCVGEYTKIAPAQKFCTICSVSRRAESRRVAEDNYRAKHSASELYRSRRRKKQANYRAENADKVKAAQARWRRGREEESRITARAWFEANADQARETRRLYYLVNKDKVRAYAQREEVRERRRQRERQKAEEPRVRLEQRISSGTRGCLKSRKGGRSWKSLVGYTVSDLVNHIERQFLPGMTWDNIGEWHVDHIVPKAAFVYSAALDPDFKAAWAITNLRPLWAAANMKKHSRRTHLI